MKKSFYIAMIIFLFACVQKEKTENSSSENNTEKKLKEKLDSLYEPGKFPFYHGVASGDPLQNAVIIWTRVTPKNIGKVNVHWKMATDSLFKNIVREGKIMTSKEKDFTVKIDVDGLLPGTFYYYQFEAFGKKSIRGRTKTLNDTNKKVRLGFASCSNYAWGYFNAYRIMGKDSLDAVIHLGDYIYEHEPGTYEGNIGNRSHRPQKEIVTENDYRTRYAQYRLDEDLQFVHAQHPFITIWDDHELANNAYDDGAQNHSENEGDWKKRLATAKKVYYEWMPIRENNGKHYRSFSIGSLANLIMIDTRTDGRSKQPENVYLNDLDTSRHIMNRAQMNWLKKEIGDKHIYKIIGNQILFTDLTVYFSKTGQLYDDGWSGYKRDQLELAYAIKDLNNIIFVTGDFHSSFAINNRKMHDCNLRGYQEYVVPSITSANYDEDNTLDSALIYQEWYKKGNENLSYANLIDHGYFVLELSEAASFASFIFCKDVKSKNDEFKEGTKFGFRSFSFMNK